MKTQERMERRSRKRSSSAGCEKMERVGERKGKMERYCSTGQSPQQAVAPTKENEYAYSHTKGQNDCFHKGAEIAQVCRRIFINKQRSCYHSPSTTSVPRCKDPQTSHTYGTDCCLPSAFYSVIIMYLCFENRKAV
jgi:hypothetical protein